jgi:2-phosphosulfolactate phosphatase
MENGKRMTIDVVSVPTQKRKEWSQHIAVVIDVLRAASSIATALANGCSEIIPVAEVQQAISISEQFPRALLLLAGERNGRRIEGFDLGNSPKEFKSETVAGKTIVMTTTNGTKALLWCEGAEKIYILSLLNLRSVTQSLRNCDKDIVVVCSGQDGEESLEDTVCAGLLIEKLSDLVADQVQLTETAQAARALAQRHKVDLAAMLQHSPHGKTLKHIGFADDLEICSRVNALDVTPVYVDGAIRVM